MRMTVAVALMLLWLAGPSPAGLSAAVSRSDTPCCELVREVLHETEGIRAGMKRRQVEEKFMRDGGVQFPAETRYVYSKCRDIKVEVDFQLANSGEHALPSPEDTVTKVMTPYLEYFSRD